MSPGGRRLFGLLLPVLLVITSCQSAFNPMASGRLVGEVRQVGSFAFASAHRLLQLETSPDDPYSVNLRITVIDGNLYIDAAPSRRWHKRLLFNTNVRIKIGDYVYPAKALLVEDARIQHYFSANRRIYQILPSALP